MNKLGFHLIGKSNEDFESCLDCVHADDSEEICTMRKCVHAIKFLYDCYEKRKDAPDTNVGKWIREVLGSTSGYGTQGRERNMTKEDAGQMLNTFIDCLYTNLTEERYWELKDAVKAMQEQKKTNLIDRQDAIDAVHYYIESGYKCDIFQELKDLPSAEPKQKTGNWIPVSERLPKTSGVYIIARWFSDGCEKRILSDACFFDGSDTWYDDTRVNHGREYVTHKIVAWMPLPEPYKGES